MKWFRDSTGRFAYRPHFEQIEIEAECRRITDAFHLAKYRRAFEPPWSTDDLASLIEQHAESLDLYADLRGREGGDVEGLTTFVRGSRPHVEIESSLTSAPRQVNRFRTTLAHECTHVVLHGPLWQMQLAAGSRGLFDQLSRPTTMKSVTRTGTGAVDWMEWQANHGSGAILMPKHLLVPVASAFRRERGLLGTILEHDEAGVELAEAVAERFGTSVLAAQVRLKVLGTLERPEADNQAELDLDL